MYECIIVQSRVNPSAADESNSDSEEEDQMKWYTSRIKERQRSVASSTDVEVGSPMRE